MTNFFLVQVSEDISSLSSSSSSSDCDSGYKNSSPTEVEVINLYSYNTFLIIINIGSDNKWFSDSSLN